MVVLVLVLFYLCLCVADDIGTWYLGAEGPQVGPSLFWSTVLLMPLAEELQRYAWFTVLWKQWPGAQVIGFMGLILVQSIEHAQFYSWSFFWDYLLHFTVFSLLTWWTRRPWWAFVVHAYSNTQLALLHLVVANG